MFIGGLAPYTNEAILKHAFEKFGEVNECMVLREPITRKPRGFGFITFKNPESIEKVMRASRIMVDGRAVDAKPAVPRQEVNAVNAQKHKRTKKIFVGGLAATTTELQLKDHFSKFGDVQEVMIMYDSFTKRSRGFGFVTFHKEDAVEAVMKEGGGWHHVDGKEVEVKRAVPKTPFPSRFRDASRAGDVVGVRGRTGFMDHRTRSLRHEPYLRPVDLRRDYRLYENYFSSYAEFPLDYYYGYPAGSIYYADPERGYPFLPWDGYMY
ncbi:RNA-binding protein Musashi homolog 1-like [Zophobas morio]|uniref:RNA-binding protein Musashi homolog 1-like n=1 Tax=Zophobas morio TaxID=2755281 RepID=UPI0030836792